jgi:hypothetical protein
MDALIKEMELVVSKNIDYVQDLCHQIEIK